MNVKSKWTQQRDDFFKKQFNVFFAEWKKKDKKKNTQGEFARQICEIRNKKTGEKCPVTNSYVSEWARGKWFPDQYLPEIAEVLGVDQDDFFFKTHDDLYKLSSEYMTKIAHKEIIPYCEEIGLDLDFLYTVRHLFINTFEEVFPLWSPITRTLDTMSMEDVYIRKGSQILSTSAEMDGSNLDIFQCAVNDGEEKTITLSRADLLFLRDVQEEVRDYIEFLFMKRSKEQKKEAEEATQKCRSSRLLLKADDLNQIDKYFKGYTDKRDGE